jgi:hypothetical protein
MYNLGSFFKYFSSIDIIGLPNINGNTEFWKYISEIYYFRKIYELETEFLENQAILYGKIQ